MIQYTKEELANEEWRPIKGYEGLYEVSSTGKVRSLGRRIFAKPGSKTWKFVDIDGKIMKQSPNKDGYLRVMLSKNNKRIGYFVHRLGAAAFAGNPNGYGEVNHKDEDKSNNYMTNLEWCSRRYNNMYGTRLKRVLPNVLNHVENSKKKVAMYDTEGNFIRSFNSIKECAEITGLHKGNICGMCKGSNHYHHVGGYVFKYYTC